MLKSINPQTHTHTVITLKALNGDVNNTDYLGTVAPVRRWDILGSNRADRSSR